MAEKEKTFEKENLAKTNEISITKKSVPVRKHQVKQQAILPSPSDFYKAFDDTFERFRRDFEDVLFPTYWDRVMSLVPEMRIPAVDLEDREKDFILKVEMPGFKKEDIEIEVQDDSLTITGEVGWKYDKKTQVYLCRERACKTFYRRVDLPEEINVDEVTASLTEGVLDIIIPKKTVKQKRIVKMG